jgi:hypothetical protein
MVITSLSNIKPLERQLVLLSKIDLREIGWDGVGWIYMAQGRDQWRAFVNTILNIRVP